ncbi:MAG: cation diffusion facilitator family transporter [Chloroflexota bacterium]
MAGFSTLRTLGYRVSTVHEPIDRHNVMSQHAHDHTLTGNKLRSAFFLTLLILVVELVAGIAANSLALLSDAGHILTDVFALGIAWFAIHVAERPPNERNTFGYQRSSILAALANATSLIVIAVVVIVEAVTRLSQPPTVSGGLVAVAALAALGVNLYIARTLHGHEQDNLNVRAAFLHVVGDIAASAAVIVGGVVIVVWRIKVVDPILSVGIALLIAYGAWQVLRDTLFILMESTPRNVSLDTIEHAMLEVPGVESVHDLHVWSLYDGFHLLSAHVLVPEQSLVDTANLLSDVKLLLRRRFSIDHATLEPECINCSVPQRRPIRLYAAETVNGSPPDASEDVRGPLKHQR